MYNKQIIKKKAADFCVDGDSGNNNAFFMQERKHAETGIFKCGLQIK